VISKLGLGRPPGDIVIEREGFSFVSALVSALLWLLSR
jgi:Protein of unknown function (DUF2905)